MFDVSLSLSFLLSDDMQRNDITYKCIISFSENVDTYNTDFTSNLMCFYSHVMVLSLREVENEQRTPRRLKTWCLQFQNDYFASVLLLSFFIFLTRSPSRSFCFDPTMNTIQRKKIIFFRWSSLLLVLIIIENYHFKLKWAFHERSDQHNPSFTA